MPVLPRHWSEHAAAHQKLHFFDQSKMDYCEFVHFSSSHQNAAAVKCNALQTV